MPTGIILLDKPKGLTSNGALQRVRKAWKARSAGHVGTLDPMATGMLPVCLDEANLAQDAQGVGDPWLPAWAPPHRGDLGLG